jgi:hypothetical protein
MRALDPAWRTVRTLWVHASACVLLAIACGLAGCATPAAKPSVATAAAAIPDGPVDVWILPLEGVPHALATSLTRQLADDLHLNVRLTTHSGTNPQMYGAKGQMISEQVVHEASPAIHRLYDVTPKTAYIILTAADLNGADGTTRFVFATHFSNKIPSYPSRASPIRSGPT